VSADADFWTTWGREFCEAMRPHAPDAVGQDAYEVAMRALNREPTQRDLLEMDEAELRRMAEAAAQVFELESVDIDLIRKAVEATRWHWPDTP
jgi:hypothetical protein